MSLCCNMLLNKKPEGCMGSLRTQVRYKNTCTRLVPEKFIDSVIHSSSVPSFICSFMLPSLHLQSLSELPLFIRLCPSPSLAALIPSVSQQVACVSSPVLFIFIGQSIDSLRAGASTQLRQSHKVSHSITCCIFCSFIKSLGAEWDFYVWFGMATEKANKMSNNTI